MRTLLRLVLLPLVIAPPAAEAPMPAEPPLAATPPALMAAAPGPGPSPTPQRTTHQVVVRLSSQPWQAPETTDASELLGVPAPWPEGATLDAIWEGLYGERGDDDVLGGLLAVAEGEGLLDVAPDALDDPWDRYAALWVQYAQLDFFADEGWTELGDDLLRSIELAPDHPTADAMRVGVLMLGDTVELQEEALHDVVWDLANSPEPAYAALGAEGLRSLGVSGDALTTLPEAGSTEVMRVRLRHALDEGDYLEASDLAEALLVRDDLADDARREAALAGDWAGTQPDWVEALSEELRACAGIAPWDEATLTVRDGTWLAPTPGGVGDCLHGWAPEQGPQHADVVVRTAP